MQLKLAKIAHCSFKYVLLKKQKIKWVVIAYNWIFMRLSIKMTNNEKV